MQFRHEPDNALIDQKSKQNIVTVLQKIVEIRQLLTFCCELRRDSLHMYYLLIILILFSLGTSIHMPLFPLFTSHFTSETLKWEKRVRFKTRVCIHKRIIIGNSVAEVE